MIDHKTFDCGNVIVRVTPGRKRVNSGFIESPTIHLFTVPGTPHQHGIKFTEIEGVRELKRAIDFALEGAPS